MKNDYKKQHKKEAVKARGEVFTPEYLVEEMLAKIPSSTLLDPSKTVLDNSCGSGNFLVKVLELRMAAGHSHEDSLKSIYGVELDENNFQEAKRRLSLGKTSKVISDILDSNMVCADALDPSHPGWSKVGFYWEGPPVQSKFFG